jgi:putative PIN family toxin of toxin-antitoxin system
MRVNKFVLDTNVYISYFINQKQNDLFNIIKNNNIIIYSCDELFIELIRVFNYEHLKPYKVNVTNAIKSIKAISIYTKLNYPIKNYIPNDNADNYIIALALQTNSGFVTSGDKHILSQKSSLENKFKKLKIITKSQFEKMMIKNL